uniref:Putative secreted protein n=1 Tax=Ixodes ricinus TaxID=34613 RepID=A0A6B0U2J5_IXORI
MRMHLMVTSELKIAAAVAAVVGHGVDPAVRISSFASAPSAARCISVAAAVVPVRSQARKQAEGSGRRSTTTRPATWALSAGTPKCPWGSRFA